MDRLIEQQSEIAQWLSSQREVRIAVAFWGSGAADELGIEKLGKGTRILLDLSAGATNPEEVRKLQAALQSNVRRVDRLHAKVWIGDDSLIIGSANASANGLGLEGTETTRWKELGALVLTPATVGQAKRWFDALWGESKEIAQSDLGRAKRLWRSRRQARPPGAAGGDLLRAVIADPDAFKERRIFVAITNAELSAKADRELDRLSALAERKIYAYEDWEDIPEDARLVSLTYYDETFGYDEPTFYSTATADPTGKLQIVQAIADIEGFRFGDFRPWRDRMSRLKSLHPKLWRKGDVLMDLVEFVELTHPKPD